MAMRRRFPGRRRARRVNPYDVQRFHVCRKEFMLGGSTCATQLTDSIVLMAPGEEAAVSFAPIIPGPNVDNVSKGVTLGGMRFWVEWALNSDSIPADYGDLVTMATVMFWIAKVPVTPETISLAYVPQPLNPNHQGDRAQRENILWQKLYHIPIGFNDGTTSTQLVSSTGAWANRDTSFFTLSMNGSVEAYRPYRIKTKRSLSEWDALLFGVSSVTGVNTIQTVPLSVDLYGQVAIKRGRKTGL